MKRSMRCMVSVIIILSTILSSSVAFGMEPGPMVVKNEQTTINRIFENLKGAVDSVVNKFGDMGKHWSREWVGKLVGTGVFSGYSDGTFRPDNPISRAEFTKILITSLHEDLGMAQTGHWSQTYIDRAMKEGYLIKGEFDKLDQKITRGEIAMMVSRALNVNPSNIEKLRGQIKDLSLLQKDMQDHVAKVYAAGIIKGYSDGYFRPERTATRAEASTILVRLLDPSTREIPAIIEKPIDKNAFVEPIFKVRHYTELSTKYNQYANNFIIYIDNYEQYDESYYTKVECINIPELNEHDYLVWGDTKNYVRSRNDNWLPVGRSFQVSKGRIWGLSIGFYTTQENMSKIKLYEGMKLDFKISIKKGNEIKVYYQTVIAEEIKE